MPHDDKRQRRKEKRDVKKSGTRRARHQLKRSLAENPNEAHQDEMDYGELSSEPLNAQDHDATRRRESEELHRDEPE
jgi:hypothetical protein